MRKIQRALISVSDKSGIVEFAQGLAEAGTQIVSTGGTATTLQKAGIDVTGISDLTGFPEMLDGRVKTLHPKVHGGILARRDVAVHIKTLHEHGIGLIDLICVNLYPFAATVAKPGVTLEDAVENIDIGGPAMVRSAAKNHDSVTVVVDPADYETVLAEIREWGDTSAQTKRRLMVKAYEHTAAYDALIGSYFRRKYLPNEPFPNQLTLTFNKEDDCRYGENPHQRAAFYHEPNVMGPCVATAEQVYGKALSFNNIYDVDAGISLVKDIGGDAPVAVVIKHANPCGAARAHTTVGAYKLARAADTTSAFGGILVISRPLTLELVHAIFGDRNFFEIIVAPTIDDDALEAWKRSDKKWAQDCRLLVARGLNVAQPTPSLDMKRVEGGLLVQEGDSKRMHLPSEVSMVTNRAPTDYELTELFLAERMVKRVHSNAIVLVKEGRLVGMGAGQPNRVTSVKLALGQAGDEAKGAVMASDAFFPFPDGPEAAAQAGITAIIQPGGSVKDQETIDVCNQHDIAMVFTGVRHFLH